MAARVTVGLIRTALLALAILAGIRVACAADAYQTSVPHAILVDYDSGSVLFEKSADVPVPPASLTKMMTMVVVFQAIKDGKISVDDEFVISEHAWRHGGAPSGGSAMFAILNSRVKLSDLMQGVIVQSGNDAAIAIAEGLMGNEPSFAQLMTARAKEIGLTSAMFRNPTGYHDPDQKISARDVAKLGAYIIRNFPEFYPIYGQRDFTWNKIFQQNRNPLLAMGIGADGLKTGYVKEGGYNLAGSAVQSGQRLIVVVMGAKNEKERAEEARKLLDWGFRNFELRLLFDAGATVAEARMFGGVQGRVKLAAEGPVKILVPRGSTERVTARVVYQGPVRAPVAAGTPIGKLRVMRGETLALEMPLHAAEDVAQGSLWQRALDGSQELVIDLFRSGIAQIKAGALKP
ncbi:D-alanyl-D-alanine carboxypeptidase family protein [Blastochloris viridis]|uniref:serine-type D-Ala-D-Ala carboxypeptidase n=1 Tax=Blastochloris viridis TaxID=1079 RepID=A0A0H5BER1_BLAVI|nr:D-alanyl-D-alanine carboxypeptidase family protein [Blastochloris viridis]ALK09409.1 D-alanyl-D-alanine carboxypeptidase DacA precursor [Blastochloris viridis]BAS00711.1 D-alanyl-D-alanine carboxypeptidase [Blastochloris viridis]CUU42072.1 D-alanyl-D-alanine carboxypeptidase dacA precursor [Blastochloris viridis]